MYSVTYLGGGGHAAIGAYLSWCFLHYAPLTSPFYPTIYDCVVGNNERVLLTSCFIASRIIKNLDDHVGCLYRADWLSHRFLEVARVYNLVEICDITNGVSMFVSLMFFQVKFSSSSPYAHIQIAMCIFAMILSSNKPATTLTFAWMFFVLLRRNRRCKKAVTFA